MTAHLDYIQSLAADALNAHSGDYAATVNELLAWPASANAAESAEVLMREIVDASDRVGLVYRREERYTAVIVDGVEVAGRRSASDALRIAFDTALELNAETKAEAVNHEEAAQAASDAATLAEWQADVSAVFDVVEATENERDMTKLRQIVTHLLYDGWSLGKGSAAQTEYGYIACGVPVTQPGLAACYWLATADASVIVAALRCVGEARRYEDASGHAARYDAVRRELEAMYHD